MADYQKKQQDTVELPCRFIRETGKGLTIEVYVRTATTFEPQQVWLPAAYVTLSADQSRATVPTWLARAKAAELHTKGLLGAYLLGAIVPTPADIEKHVAYIATLKTEQTK